MYPFEDKVARMRSSGDFFDSDLPIYIARAPGRMDLMGGNVDYTGGLVFEMTIREATWAAVQLRRDEDVLFLNPQMQEYGWQDRVKFHLSDLGDEATVRSLVNQSPGLRWTAYVLGNFHFLRKRFLGQASAGMNLYLESDVPLNKGVSSSAAVEVAVMKAAAQAYGIDLKGIELARACQWVENVIAGSACGIMDQAVIVLGKQKACLPLLCQPCIPYPPVAIAPGLAVWAIDSGVRHAVTGIEYEAARAACFMGYKLICNWEGLELRLEESDGISRWVDSRWNGYPSNMPPSVFRSRFENRLPETWTGEEYLRHAREHIDPYTPVQPQVVYPIRACMRYAVEENHRIRLFAELVRAAAAQSSEGVPPLLGELMYQSHHAYTECGLGCEATDSIVNLIREEGAQNGLFGAKISGGGSGGAVAVLGRQDASEAFRRVVGRYGENRGLTPYVFEGSSEGADQFGILQV